MAWIKTISYREAEGMLKKIYNKIKGPNDHIDHVLTIHSLRPHTLEGHMALYKSTLHHIHNSLPKWYLETLGIYVSHLNQCNYCVSHHSAGLKRNLNNEEKYVQIINAIEKNKFESILSIKYLKGMDYAFLLTTQLKKITEKHVIQLRNADFTDAEILEINQLVSYFNYVNRTVIGLGVQLENSHIGLSPSDSNSDNWSHK